MHEGQQLIGDLPKSILKPDAFDAWAFLVTEVGEVGDALLREGYGYNPNYIRNNSKEVDLAKELGDVYLTLCTLANCLEIDLGEALQRCVENLRVRYEGYEEV